MCCSLQPLFVEQRDVTRPARRGETRAAEAALETSVADRGIVEVGFGGDVRIIA